MNKEKINKLLDSSNIEDIKLGIVYFCKEYDYRALDDRKHNCKDVPGYLPEYIIEGTELCLVVFPAGYIGLTLKSTFANRTPEPGELF